MLVTSLTLATRSAGLRGAGQGAYARPIADQDTDADRAEAEARAAGLVRDDFPDLDEALDPEFEPEFEVDADPELERRDLHEADEQIGGA